MDVVDLNGRQDEPAVRSVLELSQGSVDALEEARAHYRTGEWLFLGWQKARRLLPVQERNGLLPA